MALEAQNNPFPSVLMVEAADETDPTPDALPAAGQQRLIVGPDHLLYLLDDTGTATLVGGSGGNILTDTAWAAKGDLVVGSANDTAVIKTVGSNDTILMADSSATGGIKWVASQTPSTQAFSDAAAEGTADTYARGDHLHGMPASPGGGGGGQVWLARQTASSSAQLDFTSFISSTYDNYLFKFVNIAPATDGTMFQVRVGTGGGPTYDTGTNYGHSAFWKVIGGTAAVAQWGASATSSVSFFNDSAGGGLSNVSGTTFNGTMRLYDPAGSHPKLMEWDTIFNYYADDAYYRVVGGGIYTPTTALTAIRFFMASGNIASGTVDVFGLVHA